MHFQSTLETARYKRVLSKGFRAEQAVLWGWKAEISTLLSKRICFWKRERLGQPERATVQKCRWQEGLALEVIVSRIVQWRR